VVRSHLNRVVLVGVLLVVLPAVAITERLRKGAGRTLTVATIRRVARVCGIRIEVSGAEQLDDHASYVLVPNHTSPVDIAAVLVARPDARFVAAAELFRIPLLGSAMRALGTVPIERGNAATSRAKVDELSCPAGDRELVVFPEGGIAPDADVLPFKTGAFVVAINSGASVVPVAITGAAGVLPRDSRLRVRPGTIQVHLLTPVPTTGLDLDDRADLARSARDHIVASLHRARTRGAA
jgi:1-acyl-sn-glycerol-3-phosphate acyltransferase